MHFQVPSGANSDNCVTIGLDRNNASNPAAITSRGFGIGQYTLFHHPPTPDEVAGVIADPAKNVQQASRGCEASLTMMLMAQRRRPKRTTGLRRLGRGLCAFANTSQATAVTWRIAPIAWPTQLCSTLLPG